MNDLELFMAFLFLGGRHDAISSSLMMCAEKHTRGCGRKYVCWHKKPVTQLLLRICVSGLTL